VCVGVGNQGSIVCFSEKRGKSAPGGHCRPWAGRRGLKETAQRAYSLCSTDAKDQQMIYFTFSLHA